MEWLFFALGVAVIAVIGIALGLVAGRAIAARAERREGNGEDAFMTPVGAPEEPGAGADVTWPAETDDTGQAPPSTAATGADEPGGSGAGRGDD